MIGFGVGPFILMYHSVTDGSGDRFSVSVGAFRAQLGWLYANGFEVIPLPRLVELLQRGDERAMRKKVVITFDDGYRDFLTNALPILLDHRASATVFLVTGLLGRSSSWNAVAPYEPLMTESEVREVAAAGTTLGSHTVTHAKLTGLDDTELARQLMVSQERLADLGETFFSISFPWGQYADREIEAVQRAGYACSLAVGEQTRVARGDIFRLPRVTMTRDLDLFRFQALLTRSRAEMALRWGYRRLRESGVFRAMPVPPASAERI